MSEGTHAPGSEPRPGGLLGAVEMRKRLLHDDAEQRIVVSPISDSEQLQPASLDVRLGPEFKIIKIGRLTHLDPLDDPRAVERDVKKYTDSYKMLHPEDAFILHPGEFVLGSTLEFVRLPLRIAARLEGRSSWGRLGILIHSTAGYIDPGFAGTITLELKNMGKVPVPLFPGVRVGQLSFYEVENDRPYKGKYQHSFGVKSSAYFNDREYAALRRKSDTATTVGQLAELFSALDAGREPPVPSGNRRLDRQLVEEIVEAYRDY